MSTFPNATHASPHFTWKELRINPLTAPKAHVDMAVRWCREVGEPVRAKFGKPVNMTSFYRGTAVQAQLWKEALAKYGSATRARQHVAPPGGSSHEKAQAGDFWIAGVPLTTIAAYVATLPTVGGIGIYPGDGFIHVDIAPRYRGVIRRW